MSDKKINEDINYMKNKKNIIISILLIVVFFISASVYLLYNYAKGFSFQNNKNYERAIIYYKKIDFIIKTAKEKECYYQRAIELRNEKDFDNSILYFEKSNNYNDSQEQIKETKYQQALYNYNIGNFEKSKELFKTIQEYKDTLAYLSNNEIMINIQGIWQKKNDSSNWIYEITGWKLNVYSDMSIGKYIIENEHFYRLPGNMTIQINNNEICIVLDSKKSIRFLNYDKNKNIITDDLGTFVKQPTYKIKEIKEPSIGMTKSEVENSTWGKPEKINRTETIYGIREQWCYSRYRYIYFENGIVTSIQN